ncbi:unnamed protein product [Prunus brigantina]
MWVKGALERNCPIWKEKKNKRKNAANTAEDVTESDGELLCVNCNVKTNTFANSSRCSSSDWILDSRCSYHMYSNKEWFDTYNKEDGSEVMMGDGSMCRVKSTGTIKVKMHDGAIRTLGMVRHIPKLCKNLISLGTLDKNGYSFKANGGKLIISKGSLVIMKGEIQPNCLYRLCGTTITSGTAVSTGKDSEDETQLWHLRLGHMIEVENLTRRKIKILRSDNGGEYKDNKFLEFCSSEGIKRHFTVRKTPQQNEAAERMNRTFIERERCMRIHVGLPKSFWAESVNHIAYLVFGCSAYALIPSDERSKLKPKSLECIFIGFESGAKSYRLCNPVNHKKILSRDVVFDEKAIPMNKVKNSEVKEDVVEKETTIEVALKKVSRKTSRKQLTEDVQEEVESDIEEEQAGQQQQQTQEEEEEAQEHVEPSIIARSRPRRTIKQPQRFGWEKDAVHYALNASEEEPTTFQEAVENKERESWMEAMMQEMESLHQNLVLELVPKPKSRKVMGCKWVFRKKEEMHENEVTIFKAQFVAKGFLPKEGVDYDEIFSPMVKHTLKQYFYTTTTLHSSTRGHKGRANGCEDCFPPWGIGGRHLHEPTSRVH